MERLPCVVMIVDDCCVSKFHEMFHDCDNSKETFLSRDFFKVLDSQRVACFPPTIPGLPDGREARVVTCNKL